MAATSLPGLTIRVHPADLLLSWPSSHPTQQASLLKQKGERDQPNGLPAGTEPPLDFPLLSNLPTLSSTAQLGTLHSTPSSPPPSRPNLPNTGRKPYFPCLMLCGRHACLPCGPRLHCFLPTDGCHHCVAARQHRSLSAIVPGCFRALEFCIPQDQLQEERGGSSQPSVPTGN